MASPAARGDVEAGYETMRALYSRRIFPSGEGLRNGLRVLNRVNPRLAALKAEDIVDDRIVRKLEKEGT